MSEAPTVAAASVKLTSRSSKHPATVPKEAAAQSHKTRSSAAQSKELSASTSKNGMILHLYIHPPILHLFLCFWPKLLKTFKFQSYNDYSRRQNWKN